ncbi:hypothetical protein VNO77_02541 [Canavalia gladiata]|uniref:Uncharacterized protein n=1 Tax=Canavalia gladiata TaxID=3824 RepID=A0AAN9MY64_CANGL
MVCMHWGHRSYHFSTLDHANSGPGGNGSLTLWGPTDPRPGISSSEAPFQSYGTTIVHDKFLNGPPQIPVLNSIHSMVHDEDKGSHVTRIRGRRDYQNSETDTEPQGIIFGQNESKWHKKLGFFHAMPLSYGRDITKCYYNITPIHSSQAARRPCHEVPYWRIMNLHPSLSPTRPKTTLIY